MSTDWVSSHVNAGLTLSKVATSLSEGSDSIARLRDRLVTASSSTIITLVGTGNLDGDIVDP